MSSSIPYKNILFRRFEIRYSTYSLEGGRAKATTAARGGKYPGCQLSHPQAVDLPGKDQDGKDAGRTSPRPGKRNRPPYSQKAGTGRLVLPSREFPQNQRQEPAHRPRDGNQI